MRCCHNTSIILPKNTFCSFQSLALDTFVWCGRRVRLFIYVSSSRLFFSCFREGTAYRIFSFLEVIHLLKLGGFDVFVWIRKANDNSCVSSSLNKLNEKKHSYFSKINILFASIFSPVVIAVVGILLLIISTCALHFVYVSFFISRGVRSRIRVTFTQSVYIYCISRYDMPILFTPCARRSDVYVLIWMFLEKLSVVIIVDYDSVKFDMPLTTCVDRVHNLHTREHKSTLKLIGSNA